VRGSFESAKSKISAKVNEASQKMHSMKEGAQRSVETKASSAVDKAKEVSRDLQSSFGRDSSPSTSGMDIERNSGIKENVSESLSSAKREIRSEVEQMDGTSFMAIGLGLGVLTSASLPVSETESEFVSEHAGDSLEKFRNDLRDAFNESTNVLKNKVLSDLKDIPIRF